MAMTLLQERARRKYITVKQFCEQYSISKTQAYKIINRPDFAEARIKVGTAGIRLDLDKTFEIMQIIFN